MRKLAEADRNHLEGSEGIVPSILTGYQQCEFSKRLEKLTVIGQKSTYTYIRSINLRQKSHDYTKGKGQSLQ